MGVFCKKYRHLSLSFVVINICLVCLDSFSRQWQISSALLNGIVYVVQWFEFKAIFCHLLLIFEEKSWKLSISSSFERISIQKCRWAGSEHYVRTQISEPPGLISLHLYRFLFYYCLICTSYIYIINILHASIAHEVSFCYKIFKLKTDVETQWRPRKSCELKFCLFIYHYKKLIFPFFKLWMLNLLLLCLVLDKNICWSILYGVCSQLIYPKSPVSSAI